MCISMWAQDVLDNFATVAEAVKLLETEPFRIVAPTLPNGSPANGHLAVTDASGDSAIIDISSASSLFTMDRNTR